MQIIYQIINVYFVINFYFSFIIFFYLSHRILKKINLLLKCEGKIYIYLDDATLDVDMEEHPMVKD